MSTRNFIEQARRAGDPSSKDTDRDSLRSAIERAYEDNIAHSGMTKSSFLAELAQENFALFEETVNHLFTPINWSHQKIRTLWAIKNTATGRLVTLGSDTKGENAFNLKESGTEDNLDYAPMMTGNEEDARTFVKMLQEPLDDSPVGIGETLVSLEIQEGVNPANLEVVQVKIIF